MARRRAGNSLQITIFAMVGKSNTFERAERLASASGQWIVASLETQLFWPLRPQVADYDGKEFLLLPAKKADPADPSNPLQIDKPPAIGLKIDACGLSPEQGRTEIMRFASALAWQEGAKLAIASWLGGNLPRQMGTAQHRTVREHLETDALQRPTDPTASTALALYREGISLDNPFYAFLSLYKAFGVAIPSAERAEWIERHLDQTRHLARQRVEELRQSGLNVGDYLYKQCRQAIAHADYEPFVNPDKTDDHYRLQRDLPLMRALVEVAIEETFSVKKPLTLHREHLYELEGFRDLLPTEVLNALRQQSGSIPVGLNIRWPAHWAILAANGLEREPLPEMELICAYWCPDELILKFRSKSGAVQLSVGLHFADERLQFDPLGGVGIDLDRADPGRVREELTVFKFRHAILANGNIEIWDVDANRRMGRSETYIPVNMYLDRKAYDRQLAALEALLRRE